MQDRDNGCHVAQICPGYLRKGKSCIPSGFVATIIEQQPLTTCNQFDLLFYHANDEEFFPLGLYSVLLHENF